jgi:hypothetical protein
MAKVSPNGRRGRRGVLAIGSAVACLALVSAAVAAGAGGTSAGEGSGPISGQAVDYGLSVPVRDLARNAGTGSGTPVPRTNPQTGAPGDTAPTGANHRGEAASDPLAGAPRAPGRTPATDLTFDGTGNPAGCGGCLPPDTVGDVGPNHYIQMVNATKVAIYNKAGVLQTPIFNLGSLFSTAPCTGNDGDPVVLYDELANRWVLSQFAATPNHHLCFAVSATANPLGAYHLYTFNTGPDFPDYYKMGVWPNGYYVSANEANYTAYAFDRTKMLAGNPASFVKFTGQTNFLMPADVDGPIPPAGGGLFYTFKDNNFHGGTDRLELFQLTPDFANPANSSFSLINTFPIASFTYTPCGFFVLDCVPQQGTAEGLDAIGEWPMQRFPYRSVDSVQHLVGNFTVGGGSGGAGAAIRWFELRNTGTGWSLFQEGTQDSPSVDQWMGSIAMDTSGDIALGYSESSSTTFPSIRYATRGPGDPLGTLQAEQVLQAGGGSQTSPADRWGDYSAMSVDPSNQCTFWYTNEFYAATSSSNWQTKIGNFTVPACVARPAFAANPASRNFGSQVVGTSSAAQTITVTNAGTADLDIATVGLAGGNPGDFVTENDTCTGATLVPSDSCTIDARFAPTALGARATNLRFTDNAPGATHDVQLSGTGVSTPPPPPPPPPVTTTTSTTPPVITPPPPVVTGQRAAALKKCKKKTTKEKRRKCRKRALQLPV